MITGKHVNQIFKNLPSYPAGTKPKIYCKDGFNVSMQASAGRYCKPRETKACYYEAFELDFPSESLIELSYYSENYNCRGVFRYVPVEEIAKLFEKHGGVDFEYTMKRYHNEII